jgi:hypothetical protein
MVLLLLLLPPVQYSKSCWVNITPYDRLPKTQRPSGSGNEFIMSVLFYPKTIFYVGRGGIDTFIQDLTIFLEEAFEKRLSLEQAFERQ